MEMTEKTDVRDSQASYTASDFEPVRPEMAFLAENPESFGLIPDACPLSTQHFLIGANGHGTENGEYAPVYEMESPGLDGLFALYGDLLPRTAENEAALEAAFGGNHISATHPVSRYSAALAEVTALRVLRGRAHGASFEEARALLSRAVEHDLSALRNILRDPSGFPYGDDGYFSVSMGVCRVSEEGEGNYVLDIFSAGDFRVYLLDGNGMAPLWQTATPEVRPGRTDAFCGKRIRIHRDSPIAVLLVSESVCALNATESRGLRSAPGRIWQYRLRLEDYFMRLVTDCVREHEFGERATRFFVGRSHGRDSASGAMTVMRSGVPYDVFLTQCQSRLYELGRLMELLPNGYTPAEDAEFESRAEAETAFLSRLLEENVSLSNNLTAALQQCILSKLDEDCHETIPMPDAPEYIRLDPDTVYEAYRVYDCENDEDREWVEKNRRALQENLSEHWISLRPALLSDAPCKDETMVRYRLVGERLFGSCMEMNGKLTRMLLARSRRLLEVESLLADGLDCLSFEGNDWIYARAGGDRLDQWAASLEESLPRALSALRSDWKTDTEAYRSLWVAYISEREALFRHDTRPEQGAFAEDWQRMLDGSLPESRWDLFIGRVEDNPETASFAEMMGALHRISRGTGTLLARIRSRAAESRVARELAYRPELRIAALRGAAYEDGDWGAEVIAVMDTATRNEFRATLRRWQERCDFLRRQAEAYTEYSTMYTAFAKS